MFANVDFKSPVEIQRQQAAQSWKNYTVPKGVQITPIHIGSIAAEWVRPVHATQKCAILYLHGGGFYMGLYNSHRQMVTRIAQNVNVPILMIDYRLAPEHPFPAALEDTITAYHYLLDQGYAPHQIMIMGDSAGGNLTLSALLKLKDQGDPLPAAAAALSGVFELSGNLDGWLPLARLDPILRGSLLEFIHESYIGDHDPLSPLISPLYGDLRGLPPLLLHAGTHEVLLYDAQELARRADAAGVNVQLEIWKGMWHVFQICVGYVPEATRAIHKIGMFARQHLGHA
jgi:acetyl esterase/lipase